MLFNTWLYGFFLALVFSAYWGCPSPRARPWILIGAGAAFYAHWYPPHLALVLAMSATVYALGRASAWPGARGRAAFVAGLVGTVGALLHYKYSAFLLGTLASVGMTPFGSEGDGLAAATRAPLAISFFTFEFVHYLVEVRRGTVHARARDFLLFILFFPTLVAGPIKRYGNFERCLDFTRRIDWDDVGTGLERILFGFSKKILVADTVARLTAPVWADPLAHDAGALWLASYGFALQIYFDFAGYSDIAIGSARLLGFRVEENFDWPYLRPNIRSFWQHWHMSLSSWIGDYLYRPLGGNRLGTVRTGVNRMVAMGICGLWHGAAGHFVVWGLYHGVALNVAHAWASWRDRRFPGNAAWLPRTRLVLSTLLTFHVVVVGWVYFVVDVGTATAVVARMLGL